MFQRSILRTHAHSCYTTTQLVQVSRASAGIHKILGCCLGRKPECWGHIGPGHLYWFQPRPLVVDGTAWENVVLTRLHRPRLKHPLLAELERNRTSQCRSIFHLQHKLCTMVKGLANCIVRREGCTGYTHGPWAWNWGANWP